MVSAQSCLQSTAPVLRSALLLKNKTIVTLKVGNAQVDSPIAESRHRKPKLFISWRLLYNLKAEEYQLLFYLHLASMSIQSLSQHYSYKHHDNR